MSYTFPWKIIKNGQEIVFPRGSRRFMKVSVSKLEMGEVATGLDGSALFMGDPSVRLHVWNISCSDMTMPPLSDIFPSDIVTFHSPEEFSVAGPVATLAYDPVPGSVYGVDADDRKVGSTPSASRNVSIPGAVAIRYRPIVQAMISDLQLDSEQGRATAGWSMTLRQLVGDESVGGDGSDTISFAPSGLRGFTVGVPFELNLNPLVTTNTGLPVSFVAGIGSLPPGLTLSSNGWITGTPTTPGVFVFAVGASSGTVLAVQTIPFYAAPPSVIFAPVAAQTHVPGTAFSLNLAPSVTVQNSSATPTFSIVSGGLPAGLSLSSAGVISGTPTAFGAFSVVIRATIAGGFTDDQRVAFNAVIPTIASNGLSLQDFTVGSAFSLDLATLVTITGTAAAPTFTADVGSLPAGLSMSSAGVISGTPTGYGAYAFTARAELPSGQWTEVSVAMFQLSPDNAPEAVILGGTAQTWVESGANGSTTYDACDFTASGVLTVLQAGWVEYILQAGGGGGASVSSTAGGGGGGAGHFRRERIYLPAGTYNVNIGGGGGPGLSGSGTSFTNGLNFPNEITRTTGGGYRGGTTTQAGLGGSAGSGGGGGGSATAGGAGGVASDSGSGSSGGAGNTSTTAASQNGGGGGGFSEAGLAASNGRGHGGGGVKIKLWDALVFAGGGGGGAGNGGSNNGAGGSAVGGNGGGSNAAGVAGTANTGSGGGGAGGGPSGTRTGGAGGSGRAIFIVKRRTAA